MIYLFLGVLLWSGAHLFKRLAPDARAAMGDTAGKGIIAVLLLISIVLMVYGYGRADGAFFWGRHPALVGVNNLLMLLSVYLFAASGMKTGLARKMRHPMLGAVKVWALAHLLVNGDVASFVLFGGLLAWAVVEMIVINKSQPDWTPPPPAPKSKEIVAVVASVVIYGVIVVIHYWLGYPAFG
ncbi:MAG: NnrU family protein [Rhodobacteraceae bacterium]|jgi:uncharacterized membrane protein|nr:NnrU family protein [Paracoccaceae bacterium]